MMKSKTRQNIVVMLVMTFLFIACAQKNSSEIDVEKTNVILEIATYNGYLEKEVSKNQKEKKQLLKKMQNGDTAAEMKIQKLREIETANNSILKNNLNTMKTFNSGIQLKLPVPCPPRPPKEQIGKCKLDGSFMLVQKGIDFKGLIKSKNGTSIELKPLKNVKNLPKGFSAYQLQLPEKVTGDEVLLTEREHQGQTIVVETPLYAN